jgi:AraC-like DNA-binding protein
VFHRIVGVTFQDHLVRLRLRNAEHLLRHDPSAPLRRVAAQTGFGTLRNLQDHYGRVYGYPPSRGRCLAMVVEGVESEPATDQVRPNAVFPQSLELPLSHVTGGTQLLAERLHPVSYTTNPPPREVPASIAVDHHRNPGCS